MIKALEHDLIHYNIYTNIKIIKGGCRKSEKFSLGWASSQESSVRWAHLLLHNT